MSSKLYKLIFIIITSIASQYAIAVTDYVIERSYYEDKTAQMTFDQVKDQIYHPMPLGLSQGFSSSAFWVRLKIDPNLNNKQDDEELIIRIQPVFLDEIKLYDPLDLNKQFRVVGDGYSSRNDAYPSLNFNFSIPRGDEPRYIWLRLQTTSTALMFPRVMNVKDWSAQDRVEELSVSIYVGFLILLFVFPIIIWLLSREFLIGLFVIKQFILLAHAIVILGYFRMFSAELLRPQLIDLWTNLIILTFSFVTVIFNFYFYKEFKVRKWVSVLMTIMMLFYPVELALLLTRHTLLALKINMICLTFSAFLIIFTPFVGIPWEKLERPIISKHILRFLHLVILVAISFNILPALGVSSAIAFSPYSGLAYGAISSLIFLMLLNHRYQINRDSKIAEVNRANAFAEMEKSRREAQEKLLAMLTHELKTPLTVLKMGVSNPATYKEHMKTAVLDMDEIINRCLIADKFEAKKINVQNEKIDLNNLVLEIIKSYDFKSGFVFEKKLIPEIESDHQLLKIILTNLIDNAVKYGDVSCPINIDVNYENQVGHEVYKLSIENTIGVVGTPDKEKIFDKYYRAPKAYERTGSGLGLYITHNLVQILGGQIEYTTDKNKIIFSISLPIYKA